jgi:hypothetical protein
MILFETTLGDFKIEFFEKEAPLSVATASFPASSFKAAASPKT